MLHSLRARLILRTRGGNVWNGYQAGTIWRYYSLYRNSAKISLSSTTSSILHRSVSSAAAVKVTSSSAEYPSSHQWEDQDDLPITSMDEKKVAIGWDTRTWSRFHHIWLRDHCRCPKCFHPKTMQRLLDTFEIPRDIRPIKVESTPRGLRIVWPSFTSHSSDGTRTEMEHESVYPWDWLKRNSYNPKMERKVKSEEKKILWNSRIAQSPPSVAYADVMQPGEEGERGVYKWLQNIDQFGFCFVTDVPPTAEDTEKLARKIAFIRETQYGQFWEFTSDLAKGDTAYTNIALGAHTDNTYFTDPCGLQLFHLLSHTPSGSESDISATTSNNSPKSKATPSSSVSSTSPSSDPTPAPPTPFPTDSSLGGTTLLVDGFYVASLLRELDPSAYRILSEVRIPAHAAGERDTAGIYQTSDRTEGFPVFTHNVRTQDLIQLRWNNDDRSVLNHFDIGDRTESGVDPVELFYNALRTFRTLLTSPDSEFYAQLTPGTAVVVDNHRVLHGRTEFSGRRRMCGAYVGYDDYRARWRGLREKFGKEKNGESGGGGGGGKGNGDGNVGGIWSEYY